jgi:hypothetical protein
MGVKLVVYKDAEPEIGITLEYTAPGTPGKAQGWHGTCTQCGKPMHFWNQEKAFEAGQAHVDQCE